MAQVRESFAPIPMGVNATETITTMYVSGFLAATSGTITVVSRNQMGTGNVTVVNAVPVTAGIYTPIPLNFLNPTVGGSVTLGGGASGTLFI